MQKWKERREETIRKQLQQFKKEFKEKGKHSFPYINSMKSELNACMS